MQKDPLISALVGALLLGSIATLALGIGFQVQAGRNRVLQAQIMNIQNTGMLTEALATDALQYSRRNPAIIPVLQRVGMQIPSASK